MKNDNEIGGTILTKKTARIWLIANVVLVLACYWTYYLFPSGSLTTTIAGYLSYGIYALAALLWFSVTLISRQAGVTNGIGASLILAGILWQLMASSALYQMPVIYFIDVYLPMIIQAVGLVWFGTDIWVSRHQSGKIDWQFKLMWYELILVVLVPFAIFMLGQVPRLVAAYSQYGISFDIWASYNLYYITIPALLIWALTLFYFIRGLVKKFVLSRIIGAGLAFFGMTVFCVIYLSVPTYFMFEPSPFALTFLIVGTAMLLPQTKIR